MPGLQLKLLSGGAAQGTVEALAPAFRRETGAEIAGTFGPVGAMRDKLLEGEPADLIILTKALIAELAAAGHVLPGGADLGRVHTGIAAKQGDPIPDVSSTAALRAALLAADEIYLPDPQLRATAGLHFIKVLDSLELRATLAPRLRPHPNGVAAMRALARAPGSRLLGCTQITEIVVTPGVSLVGALPGEFELATMYSAAVCTGAASVDLARQFIARLTGEATQTLRAQLGFEF
jgi:molybdate transport system substrate-binding protein